MTDGGVLLGPTDQHGPEWTAGHPDFDGKEDEIRVRARRLVAVGGSLGAVLVNVGGTVWVTTEVTGGHENS